MKQVHLNCRYGAFAPGLNDLEDELADKLVSDGYAVFVGVSTSMSVEAYDAVVAERDTALAQVGELTAERDTALAQVGELQTKLAMLEGAGDGKTSKATK